MKIFKYCCFCCCCMCSVVLHGRGSVAAIPMEFRCHYSGYKSLYIVFYFRAHNFNSVCKTYLTKDLYAKTAYTLPNRSKPIPNQNSLVCVLFSHSLLCAAKKTSKKRNFTLCTYRIKLWISRNVVNISDQWIEMRIFVFVCFILSVLQQQ